MGKQNLWWIQQSRDEREKSFWKENCIDEKKNDNGVATISSFTHEPKVIKF